MALAIARTAIAGFSEGAVGSDTSLGVHAPEQAVIAGLHRLVVRGGDELSLPPQTRTEVRMVDVETRFATMNHE
jgi:hypothetical protein